MPKKRIEILKGTYGNMITDYIDEKLESKIFDNNVLMVHDIFDLANNFNVSKTNVDDIIGIYQDLLDRNITIRFEKSKQCDSEYLKEQLTAINAYSKDNMQTILSLAINNYLEMLDTEKLQRQAMLDRARAKGTPVGNPKGSKRQTKKSIEAKKQILELSKSFNGTMLDNDVIAKIGITRNSYFKYKKELKKELEKQ